MWLEKRLEELSGCFAVEVAGFAVLDNHLHVLLRLCPERSASWSDEEVVRRWGRLFPPRGKDRKPLAVSEAWVQQKLADVKFVAAARRRLADLGWFMKCLKEPLARIANRSEGCQGHFWQGRFKSVALLDAEALLAVCAYIELNPLAAGIARTPEDSPYTSIHTRVEHCRQAGRLGDLQAVRQGTVAAAEASQGRTSSTGFARGEISVSRARSGPACWRAFRWGVTCCWWTGRAGWSAGGRPA